MKIIVSPSKTQKPNYNKHFEDREMLFPKEHKKILAQLRKLSKADIEKIMKLKGDLLHNTYSNIKEYSKATPFQAFYSFDGLVFKNLKKNNYKEAENQYIENNVRILDAFYGVLEPGTLIKPYRLDMKMNIGFNLYKHWNVTSYFKDEIIINLASDEFSKMIDPDKLITIAFLQEKDGSYKNQATYSKMARGMMLDYMIMNQIDSIEGIKAFDLDNYSFNSQLSTDSKIVFTR